MAARFRWVCGKRHGNWRDTKREAEDDAIRRKDLGCSRQEWNDQFFTGVGVTIEEG